MKYKKFILTGILALALVLSGVGGAALAQDSTPTATPAGEVAQPGRTITVTGSGQAFLTPDIAYVNVGVQTEGADAAEAVAENNTDAENVIEAIRNFGIQARDIKTTNFSIYPQQHWDNQGQPTGEITYIVQNTVMVTVRDMEQIGALLDAVVAAGSNTINGIQFDVEDKNAGLSAARQAALTDARSIAEELAQAAGVELGEIQNISTTSSQPIGVYYDVRAAQEGVGGAVPVSPGETSVQVNVDVVFAIR